MRTMVTQGRLSIIAETPVDGFELSEMVSEARLAGKYIKVHMNGNGSLGISVLIPDLEMARMIGECKEHE